MECLTNYCQGCVIIENASDDTKILHRPKCVRNYEGNSGGMEAAGAVTMFNCSVQERGVRYTQFLGDGDSKAQEGGRIRSVRTRC